MSYASSGSLKQSRKNSLLGAAIRDEITRADDPELKEHRELSALYYYAKPRGDEKPGRSKLISTDVADAVNALTAQVVPMISTDNIAQFKPEGADDEASSRAESMAVNKVILEDNQGFMELETAVRDAFMNRLGVVKVWMDERIEEETAEFAEISDLQVNSFLEPQAPNETRELVSREGLEATIRIIKTVREFNFRAVDPANFIYRANWTDRDLETCPFCAERIYYSRSELIEMGFSRNVVMKLPSLDNPRSQDGQIKNAAQYRDFESANPPLEYVECYECYFHYDYSGNGVAELCRVLLAGDNYILEREKVDLVPYATGVMILRQHRITGEDVFDRLKQTQDIKTNAIRSLSENMVLSNQHRMVVHEKMANLNDVLDTRINAPIRVKDMNAVLPLPTQDAGPTILSTLDYFDKARSESVGASLDMQTATAQLTNVAASAVERQYSSKELSVELYAKNFGETLIRRAWLLMHETLRRYSNMPMEMKINGAWQTVDPKTWRKRTKLTVKTGESISQRAHSQLTLQAAIQFQVQAMMQGKNGVLANDDTLYRTYLDWLTLAGIKTPHLYAVDPNSPEAQQAAQANAEAAQAQQAQMQELMATQIQIEIGKLQAEMKKHNEELAFKYFDARLDAETKEAEIIGRATADLEKAQMDAENAANARNAPTRNNAVNGSGAQ